MKNFFKNYTLPFIAFIIALAFAGVMAYFSVEIAIAEAAVILVLTLSIIATYGVINKRLERKVTKALNSLDFNQRDSLESIPLPVAITDDNGRIGLYNDLFKSRIISDRQLKTDLITQFTGGITVSELSTFDSASVEYNENKFTVYSNKIKSDGKNAHIIYFIDDTYLKNLVEEYNFTKPDVLYLVVDNLDEISQNYRDSECAEIIGGIEKIIEAWSSLYPCIMRKVGYGRFILIVEERGLRDMIESKFKILDDVRSYVYGGKTIGATLSIGGGRSGSLCECDESAKQALDMALGRGGDQVAIKDKGNYEFFGGLSGGVEKRTKIKTRIIASAISELIEGSDNVLIMGHSYSDLDSLGASIGVYSLAKTLNKTSKIVFFRNKTLADSLVKKLDSHGLGDMFIEPEAAMKTVTKKTLLVIVDTMRLDLIEYPPLLDAVETVIVIDHHRKTVDYITKAVIFYNEPNASSSSELVTEMLQYIGTKPVIEPIQAEALLAGIMLDTHNFIVKTGVRSFEAAAFLRGKGADTLAVKQLFANNMDNYKQKNAIIGSSTVYKSCAIAIAPEGIENIRIVASQVADELLNVSDVKSSYVLFKTDDVINISARSLGEVNVQLIMEKLNGGGHQTMAATQLEHITMEEALPKLRNALDKFFEENS